MSDNYTCVIRGKRAEDDGCEVEMTRTERYQAWYEIPLPQCPDCGGDLVWYEAGFVPGTRKCMGHPTETNEERGNAYNTDGGCGSLFSVQTEGDRVYIRRERFY